MNEPFEWTQARKHSVAIGGHKTSFSIEDEFWDYFRHIAKKRDMSIDELIKIVDCTRTNQKLSQAIRLFCLEVAIGGNPWTNSSLPTKSEGNGLSTSPTR